MSVANQKYFYKIYTYSNLSHIDVEGVINNIAQDGCRIINIDLSLRTTYITAEYDYEQYQVIRKRERNSDIFYRR